MAWTLASDIDGTLTGDRAALDVLSARIAHARRRGELALVLCTGRSYADVLCGLSDEGLPEPDAIVAQVGTEIYVPPFTGDTSPLDEWRGRIAEGYSPATARALLAGIEGLVMQPPPFNTSLKTSCYLDGCPDPEAAAREIRRRAGEGPGRFQVVWSMGRFLDLLPGRAGKAEAVRYVTERAGYAPERVVAAGDTGNDATMIRELPRGIVVGNATPELVSVADERGTDVYRARGRHAAGVEEGLVHFGVLGSRR